MHTRSKHRVKRLSAGVAIVAAAAVAPAAVASADSINAGGGTSSVSGSRTLTFTPGGFSLGTIQSCDGAGNCVGGPLTVPQEGGTFTVAWAGSGTQPSVSLMPASAGLPGGCPSADLLSPSLTLTTGSESGISVSAFFIDVNGNRTTIPTLSVPPGASHTLTDSLCFS